MNIDMDPEIAEIYRASTAVSVTKGNSHNLMKMTAKRRRSKQQIKEENRLEVIRKQEIADKLIKLAAMEEQLRQQQPRVNNYELMEKELMNLHSVGLIKQNA